MRKKFVLAVLFALLSVGSVWAETVGTPVDSIGQLSNAPFGSVNPDGTINFYIPLTAPAGGVAPVYGVGGAGLSPDLCLEPTTCGGGLLKMFLRFTPVTSGANVVTLQFNDLDLTGLNDPSFFLESLGIYDSVGGTLAFTVNPISDHDNQTLKLNVNITSNPFYLQLNFGSFFDHANAPDGWYTNTVETLRASVTTASVPEPTTLPLLGIGLVALAFARRGKSLKIPATRQ